MAKNRSSVPSFKKQQSGRIKSVKVAGQPSATNSRVSFGIIPPIVFRKLKIKTLMNRDIRKGVTQPEFDHLTDQPGIANGGSGGYNGGVKLVRQHPTVPASSNKNKRVIKPPNPAGGPIGKRLKDGQ